LWYSLHDALEGDQLGKTAVRLLEHWLEPSRATLAEYSRFKRRNTWSNQYTASGEALHNLYALSRCNDFLLYQLWTNGDNAWFNGRSYLWFFTEIGFSSFQCETFSPFHHEIVEVEPEENGLPVQVVDVMWPGLMFGDMMFSRAGVTVLAHPGVIDKHTAEKSLLHHAYMRPNRPCTDLSMGWGSNSQWGTRFERSYEDETHFYFGCPSDASRPEMLDLFDGHNTSQQWSGPAVLNQLGFERCRELVMHRCFVRGAIEQREDDHLIHAFVLRVRKADSMWTLDESLIEPYFSRENGAVIVRD
jgi:hypothetical protein